MTPQQQKLANLIEVYRAAISSGRYNQSVEFHSGVLRDAEQALLGKCPWRTVEQALAEVREELIILCHVPRSRSWVLTRATARMRANELMKGGVPC